MTLSVFNIIIYFSVFLDEISRQLNDSGAKILFGAASMSNILKEAVQKVKTPIKVVYITSSQSEVIPADGIRFDDLIDTNGELYRLVTFSLSLQRKY